MNLATWFMNSGRTAACGTGKLQGKMTCSLNVGVECTWRYFHCWHSFCLFLWCYRLNRLKQGSERARQVSLLSLCFEIRVYKLSRMILHLLCSSGSPWIWNTFALASSIWDSGLCHQIFRYLPPLKLCLPCSTESCNVWNLSYLWMMIPLSFCILQISKAELDRVTGISGRSDEWVWDFIKYEFCGHHFVYI